MFYHMSRRPITVVKTKLLDCPEDDDNTTFAMVLANTNIEGLKSTKNRFELILFMKFNQDYTCI